MALLRNLRRHGTLIAFTCSVASSSAFVACGSDTSTGAGSVDFDAGGDGMAGATGTTGGATGNGGATSGGAGNGGAQGGSGNGGATPMDSGPDVTSNGDASNDAMIPDATGGG